MVRELGTPIVLERAKKKAKKKPRWRDADTMERNLYKAARRTAKAADEGVRRYEKARKKSAKRRQDGAIIDLVPNMAEGMATAGGKLALVPLDLARAAWPRSARRATRQTVRALARVAD